MARRRFADDPTSRLAIWARRCAFFALAATVLSILIVRSGILEIVPAMATFGGTVLRTNLSAEQEAKLRDALKAA